MAVKDTKFKLNSSDLTSKKEKIYKYCSECGTKTEVATKFCTECGNTNFFNTFEEYDDKKNSKYCLSCGLKVDKKMKFCTECGSKEFALTKEEYDQYVLGNKESSWKEKLDKLTKELEKVTKLKNETVKDEKDLQNLYQKETKAYKDEYDKLNKIINDKKLKLNSTEEKKKLDDKIKELTKEKEYDTSVINKIKDKHAKEVQVEEEKLDKLVKENDATAKYITEMRHYVATKQNEAAPTMKSAVKRPFKLVVYNNTVTMGEYNNEPIQWSVISDRDGTLLLISKKCIDACKRNEILYTLSKIRQEAFSEEEKMYMLPVRNVYGSEDYKHITTLKHSEVLTYFFRKEKRVCEFTKLAGDKANFRLGKISWWIADGDESVNGSGNFSENNSYNLVHGIRPVIKIKKKL